MSLQPSTQIKWLHNGRFRRFELIESSFAGLLVELRNRVPDFDGALCYIDDQSDKIVLENDQDLSDMIGYFRQAGENAVRIRTDSLDSNECSVANNYSSPSIRLQRGISESADEGSVREQLEAKKRKVEVFGTANVYQSVVDKFERDEFEEENKLPNNHFLHIHSEKIIDRAQQSAAGREAFDEVELVAVAGSSSQAVNSDSMSNPKHNGVIPCMECGMLVTNSITCLKCHVNTHHLKLPLYTCRHCGQMSTHLQKSTIVRHIERDHPGESSEDYAYNYKAFSGQIQCKVSECFPLRLMKWSNLNSWD